MVRSVCNMVRETEIEGTHQISHDGAMSKLISWGPETDECPVKISFPFLHQGVPASWTKHRKCPLLINSVCYVVRLLCFSLPCLVTWGGKETLFHTCVHFVLSSVFSYLAQQFSE